MDVGPDQGLQGPSGAGPAAGPGRGAEPSPAPAAARRRTGAGLAWEETGSRSIGNGIDLIPDEGSGEGEPFDLSLPPDDRTGTDATGAKEPAP